jgi:uncharacterized protein (DUF427 family)
MLVKAVWRGAVLAESGDTLKVEGHHYFPRDAIHWQYLRESDHHSEDDRMGRASYYDVTVGDEVNERAAWYFADPTDEARELAGRVAFWRGVKVEER